MLFKTSFRAALSQPLWAAMTASTLLATPVMAQA
jgi:hypothetical protein